MLGGKLIKNMEILLRNKDRINKNRNNYLEIYKNIEMIK
mgnify:CR=1 FL=1|jgi:hypothetical protein